mgnify:CR=1 FL=1
MNTRIDEFLRDLTDIEMFDKYLQSNLSETDESEMEIRMMEESKTLENVMIQDAFVSAIKSEAGLLKPSAENRGSDFLAWLKQPLSKTAVALASLLMVLNVLPMVPTDSQLKPGKNSVINGATVIQPLRSSAGTQSVVTTPPHILQVDVGPTGSEAVFEVRLLDTETQDVILSESSAASDENGWLWVLVNEELRGTYRLQLVQKSPNLGSETTQYLLQFEPQAEQASGNLSL